MGVAGVVHACTDVTGFGLIGHSTEVATASHVTVSIEASEVPRFAGVLPLVGLNRSGGMASNEDHFGGGVQVDPGIPPDLISLLFDPQTSGGLLVAVDGQAAAAVEAALEAAGVRASRIGRTERFTPGVRVVVRA